MDEVKKLEWVSEEWHPDMQQCPNCKRVVYQTCAECGECGRCTKPPWCESHMVERVITNPYKVEGK